MSLFQNRSIRQEHGKLQAAHMKLSKQLQSQESRLMQVSKETEQALQDKATMEEELDLERTKMRIQAAQFTKLIDYHQNTPSVKKTKKIPAVSVLYLLLFHHNFISEFKVEQKKA